MEISKMYEQALLSEAAYADFSNLTNVQSFIDALTTSGFSPTQAMEFVTNWQVIHHQPDTESGFSATLFKSMDASAANPYVLAIRGTAGGKDLIISDGSDIVLDGLAIDQIVDLRNYWSQLTTPKGQAFIGSRLVTLEEETTALALAKAGSFVPGFSMAANVYLEWLYSRDDIIIDNGPLGERVRTIEQVIPASNDPVYSGVLDNPLTVGELEAVTGHSLGGHLSTALTRLIPGVEALTINGAGFATGLVPGLGGDAELNVRNLFGMLGGAADFESSRNLNLYGDKMPELITQNNALGLAQQGGHEAIFIEQDVFYGNTFGHGSGQMTDSLAVYDLFARLAPALGGASLADALAKIDSLAEAASIRAGDTLETLVNALGELFDVGNEIVNIYDREALYARIQAIRDNAGFQALAQSGIGVVISLADHANPGEIAASASQSNAIGLAYRYALLYLDPFAITGDDSLG